MAEVWKIVPSLPGVMASSEGRLLFPPSHAPLPNGGFRIYLTEPTGGSIARANKDAARVYRNVWMRRFGNVKVHQAVCEAFHGEKPFDDAVVIHVDENGLNNKPDNLKWGTQKENLNAPGFKAFCRRRRGVTSPRAVWAAARTEAA